MLRSGEAIRNWKLSGSHRKIFNVNGNNRVYVTEVDPQWEDINLKNQYFGDINDYKKYGLIRLLGGVGRIRTAVCWMLTPDDPRPDGHRTQYLLNPDRWRRYDSKVFDHLYNQVIKSKNRSIYSLEKSRVIPKCKFYNETVTDDLEQRKKYLKNFLQSSLSTDLVFFDPDNGLEVKSVTLGHKNSSKYLYWIEVAETFLAGHSILVYQHLPPKPRELFICNLVRKCGAIVEVDRVYIYRTQFVVFLLIPQQRHKALFAEMNSKIEETWGREIEVGEKETD